MQGVIDLYLFIFLFGYIVIEEYYFELENLFSAA